MKPFLLLIVCFPLALTANGQSNRIKQSLGIHWGPSHIARQDVVFSPFNHSVLSLMQGGVGYSRTNRVFQTIAVNYAGYSSMLVSPYRYTEHGKPKTAGKHQFTYLNLHYAWAKPLRSASQFYMGGAMDVDLHILNYVYGRIGNFGYYANFGLSAYGIYTLPIRTAQHLSVSVKVPFISWMARSPYAVNDDEFIENTSSHNGVKTLFAFLEDGRLVSFYQQQSIDLDLSYTHDLGKRWTIGGRYTFEFIHTVHPRSLVSFKNNFSITGYYKL